MKNLNRLSFSSFRIIAHSCSLNNINCTCPVLQKTDYYKYLGIFIDHNLNFQHHIDMISSRIRKLIYVFKTLRHIIIDFSTLKTLYYALCQSLITYCISSWGGAHKSSMLKIERAQRAILKVMSFLPFRFPTITLYQKTNVLTVRQLFILSIILKQHSNITFSTSLSHTKRKNVCPAQVVSSRFAQRFFLFLGSFLYNKVDNILHYYGLNIIECKKKTSMWLQSLDYNDTENLIIIIA